MGRPSPPSETSATSMISRRRLLQAGALGLAGVGASSQFISWARIIAPLGGTPQLTAAPFTKVLVDGSTLPTWQLTDAGGSGLGALPSALLFTEGESVSIDVLNGLAEDFDLTIPGVTPSSPTWISPGQSRTISFTAPTAGSYLFHGITPLDPAGEVCRAMGLAGPMIVRPAGQPDRLYADGPVFDREYTLFYQEFDDRLNAAVDAGDSGSYDMAAYEPNLFVVNGLGFPDTRSNTSTRISMGLGESVALRLIVGGQISYPMHFHGYHVEVEARRSEGALPTVETTVRSKDTVQLEIGASADVILPVDQPGIFPLHSHFVPAVTFDGVYQDPNGGSLVMLMVDRLFDDGFESGDTSAWSSSFP